jgi:hypothetical protein
MGSGKSLQRGSEPLLVLHLRVLPRSGSQRGVSSDLRAGR